MSLEAERLVVKTQLKDLLSDGNVCQMREYIQHGTITTYIHCFNVAVMSYVIATKFKVPNICIQELLVGAMLHDFFLYDWHDGRKRPEGLHGFTHPTTALANANKFFKLSRKEQNIIQSHMFPMTITKVPRTREAIIVCIADKVCATQEIIFDSKFSHYIRSVLRNR